MSETIPYWWCQNCKEEVGGYHVTNSEIHSKCGHPVVCITPEEHATIEQLQSTNADLQKRIRELEAELKYTQDVYQSLLDTTQCCGRDLTAGFETALSLCPHKAKAVELEAEVAGLKELVKELPSQCDPDECGPNCICKRVRKALSTPTGKALLAKVENKLKVAEQNWVVCDRNTFRSLPKGKLVCVLDRVKDGDSYREYVVIDICDNPKPRSSKDAQDLAKAIASLPTLLAKVEAGEKMFNAIESSNYWTHSPNVTKKVVEEMQSALSAYRAACEESEAGK